MPNKTSLRSVAHATDSTRIGCIPNNMVNKMTAHRFKPIASPMR